MKIVIAIDSFKGCCSTITAAEAVERCLLYTSELLLAGSESRAIGIRGSEIMDMDLSEALEMKRTWDPSIMNLSDILSI